MHTRPRLESNKHSISLLSAIGLLTGAPQIVSTANAAAPEAVTEVEVVVVTARKRAEEIQEVPQAVSALSERAIERTFSRDIRAMEFAVPNAIIESGNANTSSMSIRGISLSDLEKSFDPAVGVMVDDVFLGSTSAGLVSTFDVERIEVLRGPQGTLQGKNTTGGVLKLVRTKPTGEFGGKLSVALGSYDATDVKALVNFPIVAGKLAGKVSYYNRQGGGYLKNLVTGKYDGDLDFDSVTASLLWNVTDTFEAQYSYTGDRDDSDATPFINSSPDGSLLCVSFGQCDASIGDPRAHNSTQPHPASFAVDLHILRLDWDLGHHQLTSVTGYRDLDEDITLDYDASATDFYLTERPATDRAFSEELRLASTWSDRFEYVAGLFYSDRDYRLAQTTRQLFGLPFYQAGGVQLAPNDQQTESWSAFFQSDFHLTDRLSLTTGVRYIEERKTAYGQTSYVDANGISMESATNLTPVPGNAPTDTYGGEKTWTDVTPKVGLSYALSDDAMVYASYTEGFRSGGYNGRARTQAAIGPYQPETVQTVELGLKSDWLGRTLRFNPTFFYSKYDDKQEEFATFAGSSPLTVVENASSAKLWGVELELMYLIGGFRFEANYGYLDSKYDDYQVFDPSGRLVDKSDNPLLLAPEHTFALTAQYTHTLAADRDLTYAVGAKYRDDYQTSGDNAAHALVDAYLLIDASISLEAGPWKLSLFGKNLTDEDYRPFTKNVTNAVTGASLWSFSTVNPPRTWGLEAALRF